MQNAKRPASEALTPVAKICHDLGTPLGVENREDFYCSDLVELCQQTAAPGDFPGHRRTLTLIGEKPITAIREAAPYVIGGHFKDHLVKSRPDNLTFEITGRYSGQAMCRWRKAFAR